MIINSMLSIRDTCVTSQIATSIFVAEPPYFNRFFSKGLTSISTTVRNTKTPQPNNNELKVVLISPSGNKWYPADTTSATLADDVENVSLNVIQKKNKNLLATAHMWGVKIWPIIMDISKTSKS